jgi:hypothetical protein
MGYRIQHLVRACFEEFLSVQEGRGGTAGLSGSAHLQLELHVPALTLLTRQVIQGFACGVEVSAQIPA